jgi:hypothetical protein
MNPETFIQMQQKMRENQSELQNYLKDLELWESDIKTREASTSKSGVESQPVSKEVLLVIAFVLYEIDCS